MSPTATASVLLDTSTVIELTAEPERIAEPVRALLERPSTRLLVTAASAWEMAFKTASGHLPNGAVPVDDWEHNLDELRAEPIDICHLDASTAGSLDWAHRDPFDRKLVAQVRRLDVGLATRDRNILASELVATIDTRA